MIVPYFSVFHVCVHSNFSMNLMTTISMVCRIDGSGSPQRLISLVASLRQKISTKHDIVDLCVFPLTALPCSGVCHRDISLENVLMDTRMPDRRSVAAYRSGSVSSNGSCFSIASSTSAFSCNESASPRSCFDNAYSDDTSPRGLMGSSRERRDEDSPVLSNDADLEPGTTAAGTRGPGIGRPRLCDFGMSVRIPTSKSGERQPHCVP